MPQNQSVIYICTWISNRVIKVQNLCGIMKATLKYLAGIAGPSGFSSKSTAEHVAQHCLFSMPASHRLTAIVTGNNTIHVS